jgi:hypothetical protein
MHLAMGRRQQDSKNAVGHLGLDKITRMTTIDHIRRFGQRNLSK